jgi:glycosyltransferase involved in cell wall biosynthesis
VSSNVALLTPAGAPAGQGNAVTVDRLVRGLSGRGVDARVWDLSASAEADVLAGVLAARPCLVHAFHAYRAGPLALEAARRLAVPLVVTLTGTDANHDLVEPGRADTIARVLTAAAAITVFHRSITARLAAALAQVVPRVAEIPQAVAFARADPADLAALWRLPADRLLVLFPGSIRRVKRPLVALRGLEPVAARHPRLKLAYAGPVLETAEGDALLGALRSCPWARHLGIIPHAQMASLLAQADIVVNTSVSEGGMANAVLEALALGRAVLASAIDGNRSLIDHDVTGLLFTDQDDLTTQAERLVTNPDLRARLGAAARARVERDYPPSQEIDAYLTLYRSLGALPPL